jgi:hypothetical protein
MADYVLDEELSYSLGYWFADGYMASNSYRIGISSKDKNHLKKVRKVLKPNATISAMKTKYCEMVSNVRL